MQDVVCSSQKELLSRLALSQKHYQAAELLHGQKAIENELQLGTHILEGNTEFGTAIMMSSL